MAGDFTGTPPSCTPKSPVAAFKEPINRAPEKYKSKSLFAVISLPYFAALYKGLYVFSCFFGALVKGSFQDSRAY